MNSSLFLPACKMLSNQITTSKKWVEFKGFIPVLSYNCSKYSFQ